MAASNDHHERLRQRVGYWARLLRVEPRIVRIGRMKRKWGSCSSLGTVTLAAELTERDPSFQDFVIAHELLHLRVPNHAKLFKATMTIHIPDWKRYEIERNDR